VAFVLLSGVTEHYEPHPGKRSRVWVPKSLIGPGLAVGFVNIHYPVITGFLILHLAQHGGSGKIAFSAYAAMVLFSRFFFGGLPDRIPAGVTFYSGLAAMALGTLMLAFTQGPMFSIAGAAMLGLGFSFPWASVASTVLKKTPNHERGSAVGVLSAFYDFFVGVSAFIAGGLSEHFGYRSAFLLAFAGILVASFVGTRVFSLKAQPATV